jgi:hypothetical protein
MNEYAKIKPLLTERSANFTEEGEEVSVVVPSRYADKLTPFLTK